MNLKYDHIKAFLGDAVHGISEPAGPHPSHNKAVGARALVARSKHLLFHSTADRAGTTPICWVRAPPGRRASGVQLIGVATAGRYMTYHPLTSPGLHRRAKKGALRNCKDSELS